MPEPSWPQDFLVPPRKVRDYLLVLAHPDGGAKARFFHAFGYDRARPDQLASALIATATPANFLGLIEVSGGLRYRFEGAILAPDGRRPEIFTVWQRDPGSATARFITARPKR